MGKKTDKVKWNKPSTWDIDSEGRKKRHRNFMKFASNFNLTKILNEKIYSNESPDVDFEDDVEDAKLGQLVREDNYGVEKAPNKSKFESLRDHIGKTTFIKTDQRKDNWVGFAINSLCYTAFILTIGIVGANLEQLSELDPDSEYKNSEALRNKFEKMFKHSIFAQQSIKIDESINIETVSYTHLTLPTILLV